MTAGLAQLTDEQEATLMRVRIDPSERGDISLQPVLVAGAGLLVIGIVAGALKYGVLVTLVYFVVALVLVGVLVLLSEWADRRRQARPVAPFHWVRPQPLERVLTVEVGADSRLLFDGVGVVVDPSSSGPEAEAALEAWRLARPDRLPPVLAQAATARWASVGLSGKYLERWLDGIDRIQLDLDEQAADRGASPAGDLAEYLLGWAITPYDEEAAWWSALGQAPTPEDMGELLEAGVRNDTEAWCWRMALGRRPRPSDIHELRASGWTDAQEAHDWAEAFGRLPERSEIAPLQEAGVEAWQAKQWAKATGGPPSIDAIRQLQGAGVATSYDALTWSRAIGAPLSPDALKPWHDAGVRSDSDASSWRWALGADASPTAIAQLREAGVQDGQDAAHWRKALGETPTASQVRALVARGVTGKAAERFVARNRERVR